MLHTKPQGHWPLGSGDEVFLPYMGMAAILIRPWCGKNTFVSLAHGGSIWNLALTGPVVSEKTFEEWVFPYMSLCKTSDPLGRANSDPRAVVWTILIKILKMELPRYILVPNIKGLRLLVSDKKIFKVLSLEVYVKKLTFLLKMSRSA